MGKGKKSSQAFPPLWSFGIPLRHSTRWMINKIFPSVSRIESGWLSAPATKREKKHKLVVAQLPNSPSFCFTIQTLRNGHHGKTTPKIGYWNNLRHDALFSTPRLLPQTTIISLLLESVIVGEFFPPFASLLYIILLHRRYITKKGNSFLLSLSFKSGVNLINKSLPSVSIHRQLLFQTLFPFITDPLFNLSHLTFVIDVCYTHENKLNI